MSNRKRTAAIFAILILLTAFLFPAAPAFSEKRDPTVYLPDNRFADFQFQHAPANAVIVQISSLDDRLNYVDFERYIILRTKSGKPVNYVYTPLSTSAYLTFTLADESIYLTLSDELYSLPGAEYLPAEIDSPIPLTVDADSIRAASQYVRSGKVILRVDTLAENDELLSRAASGLKDMTIEAQYHFDLALTVTKIGSDTADTVFYGSEGRELQFRAEIPNYRKNYTYALLTEVPRGILIHTLSVAEVNGFYFTDFEITRNGRFSIIAYRTENFPLWAVIVTVAGGLAVLAGCALTAFLVAKKRGANGKPKDRAPAKQTDHPEKQDSEPAKPDAGTGKTDPNPPNGRRLGTADAPTPPAKKPKPKNKKS